MNIPFHSCPKCGHQPLPKDQAFPCECPACGLILAKYRTTPQTPGLVPRRSAEDEDSLGKFLAGCLFSVPGQVEPLAFWGRMTCFVLLLVWGWRLVALDVATGEINGSFIHNILLPFHEAGHLIFRPFGEFATYLGGTLGQLLMPVVLMVALVRQNGDSFGASLGFWLLGASLLDVAPYMYDALHPQLVLLSGATGSEGGHDWIYLFSAFGLLRQSQHIGMATKTIAVMAILLANCWGAWLLYLQHDKLGER